MAPDLAAPVFEATLYVTVPFPVPLAPEVMVTQSRVSVAVQEHPGCVVTLTCKDALYVNKKFRIIAIKDAGAGQIAYTGQEYYDSLYDDRLGCALMTYQPPTGPNIFAALIFYLIFIAGLIGFVIIPAIDRKTWTNALFMGAFFGLVTYATYDLTNLATIKDWPLIITIIDLFWGMVLSASVSLITYLIAVKIGL